MLPGETVKLKAVSADTDGAYTSIKVIDESQSGNPVLLNFLGTSDIDNISAVAAKQGIEVLPTARTLIN